MRQRKLTLLLFYLMLIPISQAQVTKTINVLTPGALSASLTTTELGAITDLTVTGYIDARDFKTMRDLIPNLAELDLTNANIVAYSGTLGTDGTIGSSTAIYVENAIPQYAFHNTSTYSGNVKLKNVILPNSITTISNNAFASCRGLKSVKTPDTINSIGSNAFYNCRALENFIIPSSITSIENHAFCDTGLRRVIIPNNVRKIGSQSFWSCDSLTMVSLPNSLIDITSMAFGSCGKLDSVYVYSSIPLSLSYSPFDIEDIAHCALYVPYNAKSIYSKDKIWNKFSNIIEDNSGFFISSCAVTIKSEAGAKATVSILSNTDWTASSDQTWLSVSPTFGSNDNILNFTAEENQLFPTRSANVTISAKNKVSQTITVTQDGSLKTLVNIAGELSFKLSKTEKSTITFLKITGTIDTRDFKILRDSIPNLLSLDLKEANILAYSGFNGTSNDYSYPENKIPRNAFYNSETGKAIANLKSIILPANTKSIGQSAFFYNEKLVNVVFPNTLTSIESSSFSSCKNLQNVKFPEVLTSISTDAFSNCNSITEILIPTAVTTIGDRAFSNCSALSHVIFPNNIKYISRGCFEYCSVLDNFTIPNSVEFIDMSAFSYCSGLTSITIPNSVTIISHRAFEHCYKFKNIIIPSSVTYLGNYAFYFCDSIESVTIPNSVTSTGSSVFELCRNLKTIYNYCTTPITIYPSSPIFGFVSKTNCILYIPSGTKSAYQAATEWKDFVNIIEFTTGFHSIRQSEIKILTENSKLIIKNAEIGNEIIIYSISGQKIKKQLIENYQTEISLPNGIYVIRIGNYSDKVVIK